MAPYRVLILLKLIAVVPSLDNLTNISRTFNEQFLRQFTFAKRVQTQTLST